MIETLLPIIGFVLQYVMVPLATYFLQKNASDEQGAKDLIEFLEIMSRKGLVSVDMRLKASSQIDRVKEMWAKEENK